MLVVVRRARRPRSTTLAVSPYPLDRGWPRSTSPPSPLDLLQSALSFQDLPLQRTLNEMKVVGLLSGGKDSCYNLCHAAKQGHEIVALATLAPPSGKGAHILRSGRKGQVAARLIHSRCLPLLQTSSTRTCTRPSATMPSTS